MRLDHYGYVVADIQQGIESFRVTLDAEWDGNVFEDPHQQVKVAFLATHGADARLELVEPMGTGSPVSRFLAERGGGLHHVCYSVEDLDAHLAEMRRRGAMIAKRPKPAVAFGGRRIAWVITREKLLVEYLESGPGGASEG
jgi:methylmalonyl-CoA/ethylmalonyl-CoA epimerase